MYVCVAAVVKIFPIFVLTMPLALALASFGTPKLAGSNQADKINLEILSVNQIYKDNIGARCWRFQ